jgi:hypothetical protein
MVGFDGWSLSVLWLLVALEVLEVVWEMTGLLGYFSSTMTGFYDGRNSDCSPHIP